MWNVDIVERIVLQQRITFKLNTTYWNKMNLDFRNCKDELDVQRVFEAHKSMFKRLKGVEKQIRDSHKTRGKKC